jgi:LacI family transcriptional regulator
LKQYGIDLRTFFFNPADSGNFVSEATKILELNPDGIILAPFFLKESMAFVRKVKKRNVPFVFIDSDIKQAGQLSYIGQDSFQSGMVAGKLLSLLINRDSSILVLHFAKEMDNQNHLILREKGFYRWFQECTVERPEIITMEISHPDSLLSQEKIKQTILKKNIRGVFVTNSKVFYLGRIIKKYKLTGLKVIGHDLLKENIAFVKEGIVHFLICQHPEEQGYNALDVLFRSIIQKRKTDKEYYTSIDIAMKENIDYYKNFNKTE